MSHQQQGAASCEGEKMLVVRLKSSVDKTDIRFINISKATKMFELKRRYSLAASIPIDAFTLVFGRTLIDDYEKTAEELEIKDGDEIDVLISPRP